MHLFEHFLASLSLSTDRFVLCYSKSNTHCQGPQGAKATPWGRSKARWSLQYAHIIVLRKERAGPFTPRHSYLLCWALPFNFRYEVYVSWCTAYCSLRSLGSQSTHRCVGITRDEKQNIVFRQFGIVECTGEKLSCSLGAVFLLHPLGIWIYYKFVFLEIFFDVVLGKGS